jgi:hypothetical protein
MINSNIKGGKNEDKSSLLTPFHDEALTSILSEAKPYRNVMKRYWTDEEVIIKIDLYFIG